MQLRVYAGKCDFRLVFFGLPGHHCTFPVTSPPLGKDASLKSVGASPTAQICREPPRNLSSTPASLHV